MNIKQTGIWKKYGAARAVLLILLGMICLAGAACTAKKVPGAAKLDDGIYYIEVNLEGGSGRAGISSPAELSVEGGQMTIRIEWSSSNYDYMIVDGEKYLPVNESGNSVFEIPIPGIDDPLAVIADTTAMSVPHEVEYTITFVPDTLTSEQPDDQGDAGGKEADRTEENYIQNRDTDISAELSFEHSMELSYAEEFAVDYYKEGYALVTVSDGSRYLIVPKDKTEPKDLDETIVILKKPLDHIYLAASAVMDMFVALDALDQVEYSALKADSWYIEQAREAMESGDITYAGKYSAPDYERILDGGCTLAVENTMIYHTPEVKEQLESFGIPVFVDYSSYENHPLGKMEWIRLYGLLTDKADAAQVVFEEQAAAMDAVGEEQPCGKTVAFFYISSSGEVNVRRSSDYLPKMIEMAGGTYIPESEEGDDSRSSTMSMGMEDFYAQAKDADYLIYNSTIEGELSDLDELMEKNPLLKNFKAVQEGNVFCTSRNLYQSTMELGNITGDIYHILNGQEEKIIYFYQLE